MAVLCYNFVSRKEKELILPRVPLYRKGDQVSLTPHFDRITFRTSRWPKCCWDTRWYALYVVSVDNYNYNYLASFLELKTNFQQEVRQPHYFTHWKSQGRHREKPVKISILKMLYRTFYWCTIFDLVLREHCSRHGWLHTQCGPNVIV